MVVQVDNVREASYDCTSPAYREHSRARMGLARPRGSGELCRRTTGLQLATARFGGLTMGGALSNEEFVLFRLFPPVASAY